MLKGTAYVFTLRYLANWFPSNKAEIMRDWAGLPSISF